MMLEHYSHVMMVGAGMERSGSGLWETDSEGSGGSASSVTFSEDVRVVEYELSDEERERKQLASRACVKRRRRRKQVATSVFSMSDIWDLNSLTKPAFTPVHEYFALDNRRKTIRSSTGKDRLDNVHKMKKLPVNHPYYCSKKGFSATNTQHQQQHPFRSRKGQGIQLKNVSTWEFLTATFIIVKVLSHVVFSMVKGFALSKGDSKGSLLDNM